MSCWSFELDIICLHAKIYTCPFAFLELVCKQTTNIQLVKSTWSATFNHICSFEKTTLTKLWSQFDPKIDFGPKVMYVKGSTA